MFTCIAVIIVDMCVRADVLGQVWWQKASSTFGLPIQSNPKEIQIQSRKFGSNPNPRLLPLRKPKKPRNPNQIQGRAAAKQSKSNVSTFITNPNPRQDFSLRKQSLDD